MSIMSSIPWPHQVPILPNELLMHIIDCIPSKDASVFLFVCKYTFQLVRQRVYQRASFPEAATTADIVKFCTQYGQSLVTVNLPRTQHYSDAFFTLLSQLCPQLTFLQSNISPAQLSRLIPHIKTPGACFMLTQGAHKETDACTRPSPEPRDEENNEDENAFAEFAPFSLISLPCCSCMFYFPTSCVFENSQDTPALTEISHYFHHPGALRNAILPTFGADLLVLTLNSYDTLTASIARLIIARCPRLRYLIVPAVKAEGLWMMLRWCQTLVAIVVGQDDTEQGLSDLVCYENGRAVATIEHHRRVWCLHEMITADDLRPSWHIGIIPLK